MLPNMRLSGATNSPIDSIGDFLGVSGEASSKVIGASSLAQNNRAPGTNISSSGGSSGSQNVNWGSMSRKTLADCVKESAWQQNQTINSSNSTSNSTTSMPWAAAVKSPITTSVLDNHHHQQQHTIGTGLAGSSGSNSSNNNYDSNTTSTIGSWSSPETSSSNRGGWNADGSSKSDGVLDDGTAIWGNPTTKKTGIDWTEKESLMNPPKARSTSNSEKRIQKAEPTISSLNGTEAWGAPVRSAPSTNNSQQQLKNDNSGNTYGTKSANWSESSSLQATTENSSPPNNSVWNNLGVNKQKSDWLSSSSPSSSVVIGPIANNNNNQNNNANSSSARLGELNKQLESANLFDSIASVATNQTNNNPKLEQYTIGARGNAMNDLKQMSANYSSNDLLDSPNRQPSGSSTSNNQQSQQMDSASYSSVATPSRDLLKQMVHQIQLAVQAGHLNAHILNQPMSTPTLQLVYQLLQQIKALHQLQEIQHRAGVKTDMSSPSDLDSQINRIRQNISLLQKAITQQQAALTKNETIGDSNIRQQQQQQQLQANNYSYATISKLSTNPKVPSTNNMSNIISNSNIDSFRRSSLIDTLSNNSNSDSLRSAQATFDANATIDKTLSSLIQASSSTTNNILASNKTISSVNVNQQQQSANKGLLSAQSSSSTSWSTFSSGDFVSQQAAPGWPSQLRISSNVSQDHQHQYGAFGDMMLEFGPGKAWRDSSSILSDVKEQSTNIASSIARPNSASNNLKQMNENDILNNRDSASLFCDWSNNSDSGKRNFDSGSSFSSTIGGLSLQSNSWMFGPNSSSMNMRMGVIDNMKNSHSGGDLNIGNSNKSDNGNAEKMAGDSSSSSFLKPNNAGNIHRSASALYDWSTIASPGLQFNADNLSKQQPVAGGGLAGGRPAPPPGLLSNFGPIIGNSSSANGISLLDSKLGPNSNDEVQLQSRDSSSNFWNSGSWFD